jgi:hypothetical protein
LRERFVRVLRLSDLMKKYNIIFEPGFDRALTIDGETCKLELSFTKTGEDKARSVPLGIERQNQGESFVLRVGQMSGGFGPFILDAEGKPLHKPEKATPYPAGSGYLFAGKADQPGLPKGIEVERLSSLAPHKGISLLLRPVVMLLREFGLLPFEGRRIRAHPVCGFFFERFGCQPVK